MKMAEEPFKTMKDLVGAVETLGAGDFGTVIRIKHTENGLGDGEDYAVKQIDLTRVKAELMKNNDTEEAANSAIELAKTELAKMENLNHQNLVRVFGSFEEKDQSSEESRKGHDLLNVVMEYCDGGDLQRVIDEAAKQEPMGAFSEWQIQLWTKQLTAAVKYLHEAGLIHRNIKPRNVLLLANSLTIRLGEFGLATDVDGSSLKTRICSELYTAPEFHKGVPYSKKCDTFSLGVTIFQIANLELPFENLNSLLQKPPNNFRSGYSNELINLVLKLLDKNRAKRPSIDRVSVDAFLWSELAPTTPEDLAKIDQWRINGLPKDFASLKLSISKGNVEGINDILNSPTIPSDGKQLLLAHKDNNGDDLMNLAAFYGQVEVVKFLLKETGLSTQVRGYRGCTPFLRACCRAGNVDAVEFFSRDADLEAEEETEGAKAIHLAAEFADVATVELLLSLQPTWLEARSRKTGRTPFLHAVCGRNLPVIESLIKKGADVNAEDDASGSKAIHLAAAFADLDFFNYLLTLRPEWIEAKSSKTKRTPFLYALSGRNLPLVEFLIKKGADIDVEESEEGTKAIHLAASFGEVSIVDYLLGLKPQWLEVRSTKSGRTPLLWAARDGNLPVLEHLIKKGAKLDAEDTKDGSKAIHLAARRSPDKNVVEFLLNLKPEWLEEKSAKHEATPFMNAVAGNNVTIAKFLILKGADITVEEEKSTRLRAIHVAARFGGVEMVDYLLRMKPEWLELPTRIFGKTPLLCAAGGGKLEVVKCLIEKGADLEAEDAVDGSKAIHWAAFHGSNEVIDYLLQVRPEWLEAGNTKSARTPLLCAASGGNMTAVDFLLSKGANLDAGDIVGSRAIHLASQNGNVALMEHLLELRPNWLEMKSTEHLATPFLYAATRPDNLPAIEFLMKKGADINAFDRTGNKAFAIHWACQLSSVGVVDFFLKLKPEWLEAKNNKCQATPLIHAAIGGNLPVVEFLLSRGADIDATDTVCGTALHSAAVFGHLNVAKLLVERRPELLPVKNALGQTALDSAKKNQESKVYDFLKPLVAECNNNKK